MENIISSAATKSITALQRNPIYRSFIEKLKAYPEGTMFTFSHLLGSDWNNHDTSDKMAFSKNLSECIKKGYISGVSYERQNRAYIKVSDIHIPNLFFTDYDYSLENSNVNKIIQNKLENGDYVAIVAYTTDNEKKDLTVYMKYKAATSSDMDENPFVKQIDLNNEPARNHETLAIITSCIAIEQLCSHIRKNNFIRPAYLLLPNSQIAQRIAGVKGDTANNKVKYTEYIQQKLMKYSPYNEMIKIVGCKNRDLQGQFRGVIK